MNIISSLNTTHYILYDFFEMTLTRTHCIDTEERFIYVTCLSRSF